MSNTKFYIKPLHKSFTLKFSNRNVLAAVEYDLKTNPEPVDFDTDESNEEDFAEQLREASKTKIKLLNLQREFPQKVFNLTDDQADKLLDMDNEELINMNTILSMKLQRYPEDMIKKVEEAQRDPQKSEDVGKETQSQSSTSKVRAKKSAGGHQAHH